MSEPISDSEKPVEELEAEAQDKIKSGKKGLLKAGVAIGAVTLAPAAAMLVGAGYLAKKIVDSPEVKGGKGWVAGLASAFDDTVAATKNTLSQLGDGIDGVNIKAKLAERKQQKASEPTSAKPADSGSPRP